MADDVEEDLPQLFELACSHIRQNSHKFDSEKLLYFYSRYKQATEGQCKTSKPGFFDFQGKQKWDAWCKLKDMSQKEAMLQYISLLTNAEPEWEIQVLTGSESGKPAVGTGTWVSVSTLSNTDTELADENKTLFDWCKEGDSQQMEDILTSNSCSSINSPDDSGMTLLHWACDRGFLDVVRVLLRLHADINAKDTDNQTPLHYAVCCEHGDVVKILLDNGADVHLTDCDGMTPSQLDTNAEIKQMLTGAIKT